MAAAAPASAAKAASLVLRLMMSSCRDAAIRRGRRPAWWDLRSGQHGAGAVACRPRTGRATAGVAAGFSGRKRISSSARTAGQRLVSEDDLGDGRLHGADRGIVRGEFLARRGGERIGCRLVVGRELDPDL